MRSNTLHPALAAGLCIAALGVGAATLSDTVSVPSNPTAVPGGGIDAPISTNVAFVGVVLLVVLLTVGIYALDGTGFGDKTWILKGVPVLLTIILLIVVVNHLAFSWIQPPDGPMGALPNESTGGGAGGQNSSSGGGGGGFADLGGGNMFASLGLIAALLIGLLAVFGAEYIPRRGDDAPTRTAVADEATDDDAAIGEAAGRAADRIEAAEAGAENEVYRAWREMADGVDVGNPRTSTPAEFAAAAVDAGLDPDRVQELTELFEAVRYGDRPVTEEREQRAVAALREIERQHGGDES